MTLDKVELENGRTSSREVVHHHGGAGIVALNEKGEGLSGAAVPLRAGPES